MKKLVLILSLVFCGAAQADQVPDWKQKLETYKAGLSTASGGGLQLRYGFYAGAAVTTCALSTVVTAATFVADTVPVTNIASETLANISNPDYKTYQNILEWENLGNIGRGALGGGPVAVIESLEFVFLWLGGNEAQSFQALKKTYASTFATANALFAEQGQCLMNIAKVAITRAEIQRRSQDLPSPMRVPAEIHRP